MTEGPKALLTKDASEVIFRRGNWSDRFPVARLDSWIRFYEGLAHRVKAGPEGQAIYRENAEALRRVKHKLETRERAG